MKKEFSIVCLLISTFFILSCDDDQNCFTIIQKTITDGKYILVGDFDTSTNNDDDDVPNGYADVNLEVSQEVYSSYNVVDEYCYE